MSRVISSILFVTVAASGLFAQHIPAPQIAQLKARIQIPRQYLSIATAGSGTTQPVTEYGGDIRIGDLDGDGTVDFVLAKAVGGVKICYLAAFTWEGHPLWQWGDADRQVDDEEKTGASHTVETPSRPGPLLVIDIDGDGHTDVLAIVLREGVTHTNLLDMKDMTFIVLDGATGRIKRTAAPAELLHADAKDAKGQPQPANFVHQRLLAADFRGNGKPMDFVVKLGDTILVCDDRLEPLWTYRNRFSVYPKHASYIPAVGDMDGDGRDEVCGGHFLLNHAGKVLWEKFMAEHCDSVAITDWDGDPGNGNEAILSGYGQVVRASGEVQTRLGPEIVPHGQEVRCGKFLPDSPGQQMAVRFNGHHPNVLIADRRGKVLTRFEVDPSQIQVGLETVYWYGPDREALLFSPAALWDGHGHRRVTLPGIPPPIGRSRAGWYHCIPAILDESGLESVIVFDGDAADVWVYGAVPLSNHPPKGYLHTARQFNVRLMD